MAELITMRDLVPWGYEVESVWGTDLMTTRLPFLGDMKRASIAVNPNKEVRRSISSGVDPKGFARKKEDITFEWELLLADDNPANSLISLALGSAPNVATGAITNYPDATHSNLRSLTIEGGYQWPGTDLYWKVLGCRIQNLSLEFAENQVKMTGKAVCKTRVRASTPAAASPTESATSLFDGYGDAVLTWTNPALSLTQSISRLALSINNTILANPTVQGGRGISYAEMVEREVSVDLDTNKVDSELLNMLAADPSDGATAQIDLDVVLTKNTAAEYIWVHLGDCQIVGEEKFDTKDAPELLNESFRLVATSYYAIVKYNP